MAIDMARLRVELRHRLEDVAASRARIATVADEERRRIERDLHDGAQQRLVSIGLTLRHAQHQLGSDDDEARDDAGRRRGRDQLRPSTSCASWHTACARRCSRQASGPPFVTWRAVRPYLSTLRRRADRFPPDVEAAAYFVACEGSRTRSSTPAPSRSSSKWPDTTASSWSASPTTAWAARPSVAARD